MSRHHSELAEAKQIAKEGFGPYVAWFLIVLVGFWPHFFWRGAVGWVITGVWLAVVIAPILFLHISAKVKAGKPTDSPQALNRPRTGKSSHQEQSMGQANKPPPWWPRAGWGTIRDYRIESRRGGEVNISFKFVPDDGGQAQVVELAGLVPSGFGEYARGIMKGHHFTMKVSTDCMVKAEQSFARINRLELPKRMVMFQDRSDLDGDCGWTWTSNYTLVKAAPGLLTDR